MYAGGCIGLERLDLSYNSISKLYSLSTLTNLLMLDLSGNNLSSLDGLQSLDKLERLDLSGNYIGKMSLWNLKKSFFALAISFRKYKKNLVKKSKKNLLWISMVFVFIVSCFSVLGYCIYDVVIKLHIPCKKRPYLTVYKKLFDMP